MSVSPDSPSTTLQAAASLIASGRAEAAVEELTALVRSAPTYAAAHVLLANALEATGDRSASLGAWDRAYVLVPSSPLVRRERQRLLDALAETSEGGSEQASTSEEEPPAVRRAPLPPARDSVPAASDRPAESGEGWAITDEVDDAPEPSRRASAAPPGDDLSPYTDVLPDGGNVFDALEAGPEDETPADNPFGPGGTVDTLPTGDLGDELDALIRELEDAPRIRPDPDFKGPDALAGETEDDGPASETLARIYEEQKRYPQAADIYDKLARQSPDRADDYRQRAQALRQRAS